MIDREIVKLVLGHADLLDLAWGLIANAHNGNWSDAKAEWREAAERWRDRYVASLPSSPPSVPDAPRAYTPLEMVALQARSVVAFWDSLDAVSSDDERPTEEFTERMDTHIGGLRHCLEVYDDVLKNFPDQAAPPKERP